MVIGLNFFLFKAYSCSDKDVHATVLGVKTMLFCRLLTLFKIYFLKKTKPFRNTMRMSNSLDPDQA